VVGLLILAVFFAPSWIDKKPHGLGKLDPVQAVQAEISLDQARNSVRTALIQAVGGALVLFTFAVGLGQLVIARQGQLVDRFTRAVNQLGDEDVDVKLGGIFALEQIAERPEYSKPVAEILVAYLKTHATLSETGKADESTDLQDLSGVDASGRRVPLRPDLQAALAIIGGDGFWARATTSRLDLSFIDVRRADLRGVDLSGVVLLGAVLDGSNLADARLVGADLRRTSLVETELSNADLREADLSEANLEFAILDDARLDDALMTHAILRDASLKLANLAHTDLTSARLDGATLNGARLDNAVLSGASLRGSDLSGVRLNHIISNEETDWVDVRLTGAVMDADTKRATDAKIQ
jgi:uncharacterized protein YjbI with pentapeptide repeats